MKRPWRRRRAINLWCDARGSALRFVRGGCARPVSLDEGLVGCSNKVRRGGDAAGTVLAKLQADRHRVPVRVFHLSLTDFPSEGIGDPCGAIHGRTGQHDDELVAAVPCDQVARTIDMAGNQLRDLAEAFIAGLMPMAVVVGLEIIDINIMRESGVDSRAARRHSWSRKSSNCRRLVMPVRPVEAGEPQQHLVGFL